MSADGDQTWLSGDVRRKVKEPSSLQEKYLWDLSDEVGRTPAVFLEAEKNREQHQRRLNEMLEETLRQIKKARAHMVQKSKHVLDTTKSYTAKFEHEQNSARDTLRREMSASFDQMGEATAVLEARMSEAEAALRRQHEHRIAHIEENLGPIRDEAKRLTAALDAESRSRRLQEEVREQMLADEVEALTGLIDAEKFEREQHLMGFIRWADVEQQRVAKRQYQMEKEARGAVAEIRVQHQSMSQDRIRNQHGIIDSMASFVHRYRVQMAKELQLHGLDGVLSRTHA